MGMGFPMADRKLTMSDWEGLVATVGNRVDPWQGRFMSSPARLILTNSALSSLPIFSMAFFSFGYWIDNYLSHFFWEGVGDKR